MNGDGKADLICDDSRGNHWVKLSRGNGYFTYFIDLGPGYVLGGWCSHSGGYTQWADVNGDGKADMICDDTAGRHWINLSYGNGRFLGKGLVLSGWCSHSGAYALWADVNGDGRADLTCNDSAGRHWIRLSNSNGGFYKDLGMVLSNWCSHSGSRTQWADVNGDGRADILCDDRAGNHWIKLSKPNQPGKFYDIGYTLSNWCSHSGASTKYADINGDGMADMICDDTHGNHWIRTQNGVGAYKDHGMVSTGWCSHGGAKTQWADITGDGSADMLCDDTHGNHWYHMVNK